MAPQLSLLVVCLGNICRSPMAEGALRARIAEAGLDRRIRVDSVGTGDWHVGQPPDHRAIATAARHGVDIARLRARVLSAADFDEHDWLLCADSANLRDVEGAKPAGARARPCLLLEWAGLGAGREVPDPYTADAQAFEHVWGLVDEASRRIVRAVGAAGRPD